MRVLSQEEYSNLYDEIYEFASLCNAYQYKPTHFDYEEIIKFLLLFNSGSTTLCESKLIDNLYEATSYDPEKDFDSAMGIVKGTAALGAAGLVIGGAWAAKNVGGFVKYLFKKGKVKKSIAAEFKIEFDKLGEYKKLNALKAKVAELEGNPDDWTPEAPGLTKT